MSARLMSAATVISVVLMLVALIGCDRQPTPTYSSGTHSHRRAP